MSVEELLEALPCFVRERRLDVWRDKKGWEISYSNHEDGAIFVHQGPLKEALEGVYQDLKTNKLI